MMNDDFAGLVEQARAGRVRAYDALVRRFQDVAVGYARSALDDPAAAEDAAQEAFLEAYRCLPNLREPRAFPAWLRRIVRKQCDRIRRVRHPATVSLDAAAPQAAGAGDDPEDRVLSEERSALIRSAITMLPPPEREAVLLFYFSGASHAQAAAFLDVPATTIKSRLHSARRRLRRELQGILEEEMKTTIKKERPSRDPRFGDRVAELLAEYERQFHADPRTADRSLLADARARLDEALARPGPLTPPTVRTGRDLLERLRDLDALAVMLARYRAQDLSVAEAAWARWWHVWALTCAERAEETVAAQAEFCDWARNTFARETPRLHADWPYEPLDDTAGARVPLDASALPIWVLGIPQQAILWRSTGRADEWVRLADDAFARAGRTPHNRLIRFHLLRTLAECIHAPEGREAEAQATIARIAEIADEETDDVAAERWRLEERTTRMHHDAAQGDAAGVRTVGLDVLPRLQALEQRLTASGTPPPWWLRTFQHNAACSLSGAKAYDLAIPLFERVVAGGRGSAYAYLRLASAVWAASRDRARTLDLLREAAARDDRELQPLIRELSEFNDVLDDPEFVEATRKPGALPGI